MQTYNLYCMHPHYGSTFQIVVDVSLTAGELIDNLLMSGFIKASRTGYALMWRGQRLDNATALGEVDTLQNNDVLRVVELQTSTDANLILTYIQVPSHQSILTIRVHTDWTGEQLIDALWDKGFIYQTESNFLIWKGNRRIEAHQLLRDFELQSRDLLRITTEDAPATNNHASYQQIQSQLADLQTKMQVLTTRPTATPATFSPAAEQPYMSIEELVEAILNV